MYVLKLIARGTKCIELSDVFDVKGNPIKVDIYLSKAERMCGTIAVESPDTVRIRVRNTIDDTYDNSPERRKPPVHLDRRPSGTGDVGNG